MARLRDILTITALLIASPALAEDKPKGGDEMGKMAETPAPMVSVTKHSGQFGGVSVSYTATAKETYLKAEDGTPKASIFSTSYVKDGVDPGRPVTFLFNGGPGSGSLWLHMGAFGPKRVAIPSDAKDDGAPPFPIVANPDSLLDVTDIVFIDPVGTGFSHALGKTEAKDYWGVTKDAKSVAEFIRIWLGENGRWNAPKFLGGESYGTTRSAAVAHELEGSYNDVSLNGLILVSTILDFGATAEMEGNEMIYALNLPTMATTAWYHNRLANRPADVAQIAAEARAFALGDYLSALTKGNRLTQEERARVRAKMASLTGLSEAFLDRSDLRVLPGRFYKELLRSEGKTVGRLDSRYTGVDSDAAGAEPDNDPSFYGIDGGYTAAMNAYARSDLGFKTERQYVTIGGVSDWDWKMPGEGEFYFNVAPYISRALRENSGLKVFVAAGYYDFATPFFGAEYSLSRSGTDSSRIAFHYYDAGHMMYVRNEDRAKLSRDIRAFIRAR
jgi:carboxypeptidase C (cathepsin A)